VTPSPICGFEASPSGRLLAAVTPDGDQCVISADTLRPVRYRRGAHMTFATAVAFAPDESAILSTSADASATLTPLGRAGGGGGGGGGALLALLAVLAVLVAALLSLLREYVRQEPEAALQQLAWLPAALQELILR
jgi:hypothetical protein